MKKLVSLITTFALILQLGVISAFAAPIPDKTLFKDTSEIFGVYDCSLTNLSVLEVKKDKLVPYGRSLGEIDFYKNTDFSLDLLNYQLSSDKKSVTANLTSFFDGVQYRGKYVFKKDADGRIFFTATDYQGKTRNIYQSYSDMDSLYAYVESPAFNRIILAENGVLKKASALETQVEKQRAAFEDAKPISIDNQLIGYYSNADESQYVKFSTRYDYNIKDYSGFYTYTRINFTLDTKTFHLDAKSLIVKNGVATYLKDPKNYMEITAPRRDTVTNIKVVKDGKVVINQKVNLSLSE